MCGSEKIRKQSFHFLSGARGKLEMVGVCGSFLQDLEGMLVNIELFGL